MASLFKAPSRPKKRKLRSSQSVRPHFTIQLSLGMEDNRGEEYIKVSMPAPTMDTHPNTSQGPTSASFKYSSRSSTPSPSVKSAGKGEEPPIASTKNWELESNDLDYMLYISHFFGLEVAKGGDGRGIPERGNSVKDIRDEGEFIPPSNNKGTTFKVSELVEGLTSSLTPEDDETIGSAYVDGADSIFLEVSSTDLDRPPAQEVSKIPKEPMVMRGGVSVDGRETTRTDPTSFHDVLAQTVVRAVPKVMNMAYGSSATSAEGTLHDVPSLKELAGLSSGVEDLVDDSSAGGPNFGNEGDCQGVKVENSELVGGFWIDKKFVPLYKKIWCKYGHIATRKVIRTSMGTLVALVEALLETIHMMTTVHCVELTPVILANWDSRIADAEALQFNVAWLRARFEDVKKKWEGTTSLKAPLDSHDQALRLATDRHKVLCSTLEMLRAQVSAAEEELSTVEVEIAQQKAKVEEDAIAREEYLSFMQKTVLEDLV